MATEQVETQDKTMVQLAEILEAEGIRVNEHCDVQDDELFDYPVMILNGLQDGERAAEIAVRLGYPLAFLDCRRHYFTGKVSPPYWRLSFLLTSE